MPTLPFRIQQTGVSTTAGFAATLFPDYAVRPFNIGIGVKTTSTSVFSVQHTFDYTGSSAFISSNAAWFTNTGISSAVGPINVDGNYAYPVSAIRLNVTAGATNGVVTLTAIQAG